MIGYSKFPGNKDAANGTSGTEANVGGSALTDAEAREIYQGSLGATKVDANNSNSLGDDSGDTITGATAFNLEYVDSPAIGVFSNTSPGTDGLGTSG